MEARAVKISWKIMMVPHIAVLLFGLIWVVAPDISVGQDLQSFMGQPWTDFVTSNAKLGSFISLLGQVLGIQLIVVGIMAIAITLAVYRRGEKWSWWVFLAGNTLGWGKWVSLGRNYRRYANCSRSGDHITSSLCWTGDCCQSYSYKDFYLRKWLSIFRQVSNAPRVMS